MKTKSTRRGRRQRGYRGLLWALAAGLLLFGLIAQQNILLGTSSRHALLMDARTGQVLARKRSGEEAAPASLTKMMTVLLLLESGKDLNGTVTVPADLTQEFKDIQNANGTTMGPVQGRRFHGRVPAGRDGHGAGSAVRSHAAFRCRVL